MAIDLGTERDNGNGHGEGDVESAVLRRYEQGARERQPELCCPVTYDGKYLEALPPEIVERDYGCGDPSAYVNEGERVLDLGSGSGKICYILSQKVGAKGSVVGVDFNAEMLALARKYEGYMEEKLGHGNVSFCKGKIQDLALDLDRVQRWLDSNPVTTVDDLQLFESECARLRHQEPLVPDGDIDAVVSNCVLNLVRQEDKARMFGELHRVLRSGGRAVISDIVCDEDPPRAILEDADLWSGCIAGAFREDQFLQMFVDAGFYGVEILERQSEPWQVIEGIEFRSLTVRAYKGKEGPCLEQNQALVYKGPWKSVTDDDGHTFHRGSRVAVCDKTYRIMADPGGPYAERVEGIQPLEPVAQGETVPWDSGRPLLRHPRETKGLGYDLTEWSDGECCGPAGC